jgi:hypothetical protein
MARIECPFCNFAIPSTAVFCPMCGKELPDTVCAATRESRQPSPPRREPVQTYMRALDEHGQPSEIVNARRRAARDVSELLGLAKGLIADGVVNGEEASFLRLWGANHPDALSVWPNSLIFARLDRMFTDGRIDQTEQEELRGLLADLVGGQASVTLGYDGASTLPLDQPPPLICHGPDEIFVFTGRFAYGPRHTCEREMLERGSRCESNVTRRTSFLVVGTFSSTDWAHTSFGRKVQRAVELRDAGFALRIVGEDHWARSLGAVGA